MCKWVYNGGVICVTDEEGWVGKIYSYYGRGGYGPLYRAVR